MLEIEAMQTQLTRATIFLIAGQLVFLACMFWVLYLVLKSAIRDGINESRLGDSWKAQVRAAERTDAEGGKLPPIRAER